jgi:hypothetical protein
MHPQSARQPLHPVALSTRALVGAVIALAVICLFVFGGEPNPAWPKYWQVKPLLLTPAAGAVGAAFGYFLDGWHYQGGWKKALALIASVLAFLVALWLGIVLGLNGTMWD